MMNFGLGAWLGSTNEGVVREMSNVYASDQLDKVLRKAVGKNNICVLTMNSS